MVDTSNINIDKVLKKGTNISIDTIEKRYVELRFFKEKKTSRSYIYGLEGFIEDSKKLRECVIHIRDTLATGMIENTNDEGKKGYGYNGNHTKRIKEILINDFGVSSDKIKG